MTANVMGQFSSFRQLLIFGSEENMMLGEQQLNLLNKSSVGVKERSLKITVVEKKAGYIRRIRSIPINLL